MLQACGKKDSNATWGKIVKNIPLGRFCKTSNVGNAVYSLASDRGGVYNRGAVAGGWGVDYLISPELEVSVRRRMQCPF